MERQQKLEWVKPKLEVLDVSKTMAGTGYRQIDWITTHDISFDRRDNARGMPKAVVVDEAFNWGRREMRPSIPWADTIIYEAHVKGLTQQRDDVPPNLRGTYGGLSSPAMIAHFKRLGVTTVELLPIHGLVDDRYLVEKKLSNYWGYNTLAFFAPEAALLAGLISRRPFVPPWRACTMPASR